MRVCESVLFYCDRYAIQDTIELCRSEYNAWQLAHAMLPPPAVLSPSATADADRPSQFDLAAYYRPPVSLDVLPPLLRDLHRAAAMASVGNPGSMGFSVGVDVSPVAGLIDWVRMPASLDPARSGGLPDDRAARKRLQVPENKMYNDQKIV